jgi:hypothetical protein
VLTGVVAAEATGVPGGPPIVPAAVPEDKPPVLEAPPKAGRVGLAPNPGSVGFVAPRPAPSPLVSAEGPSPLAAPSPERPSAPTPAPAPGKAPPAADGLAAAMSNRQ